MYDKTHFFLVDRNSFTEALKLKESKLTEIIKDAKEMIQAGSEERTLQVLGE